MFNLSETDLNSEILGCGDGPASFNMELYAQGRKMTSVDPIYQFTAAEIRSRIEATYPKIIEQLKTNRGAFIWEKIHSPDHLGKIRMAAMEKFFGDFEQGKRQHRYLASALPRLPFKEKSFDLALCSHFLFLYPDQLTLDFHIQSIDEMIRVAKQVRIFPLLTLDGQIYPHLETVVNRIGQRHRCAFEKVDYEFQRGGNQMLCIQHLNR